MFPSDSRHLAYTIIPFEQRPSFRTNRQNHSEPSDMRLSIDTQELLQSSANRRSSPESSESCIPLNPVVVNYRFLDPSRNRTKQKPPAQEPYCPPVWTKLLRLRQAFEDVSLLHTFGPRSLANQTRRVLIGITS